MLINSVFPHSSRSWPTAVTAGLPSHAAGKDWGRMTPWVDHLWTTPGEGGFLIAMTRHGSEWSHMWKTATCAWLVFLYWVFKVQACPNMFLPNDGMPLTEIAQLHIHLVMILWWINASALSLCHRRAVTNLLSRHPPSLPHTRLRPWGTWMAMP